MENKIRRAEYSDVLRIGQVVGKREYTRDEFYESSGKLHLNKLAFESPSIYTDTNGDEHYGFIPGDEFYNELIETFKTFPDVYRNTFKGGAIIRKHLTGYDNYDVLITYYSEVKMISFYFQKSYEYAV